jgi:type IV secretory pathway TrbD component
MGIGDCLCGLCVVVGLLSGLWPLALAGAVVWIVGGLLS